MVWKLSFALFELKAAVAVNSEEFETEIIKRFFVKICK